MGILGIRKRAEPRPEPVKVTFYLTTDRDTLDITVNGNIPGTTPQQVADNTGDYVLAQLHHHAVKRRGETFERWWVEDEFGNILESHDDYEPPLRPHM